MQSSSENTEVDKLRYIQSHIAPLVGLYKGKARLIQYMGECTVLEVVGRDHVHIRGACHSVVNKVRNIWL